MYTSLNAGRQSWLSPFIQTPYESLQFHTYFHLQCDQRTNIHTPHANGKTLSVIRSVFWSPGPRTILSFIIQPIHVCRVLAHVQTHAFVFSLALSLAISFAYNIHSAGGQRSLLYIRSASSNSKRHQSHPTTLPCITMRWRGQWKTIMSVGSMKTDWASESLAKVCF